MSRDELTLFSYEILGLVGRTGAGAHDLLSWARRGRMLDWAGESQYYAEPKRLARLGYLAGAEGARQDPGADRLPAHRQGAGGAQRVRPHPCRVHAAQERAAPPAPDRGPRRRGRDPREPRRAPGGARRPRGAPRPGRRHGGRPAPPQQVPADRDRLPAALPRAARGADRPVESELAPSRRHASS